LLCLLGGGHAGAQAQAPAPPAPTASAAPATPDPPTRTIRVEAIVTDRQGLSLATLRPEDFRILDNDVARKVDAAEWRSSAPPAVGPLQPPTPIAGAADEARAAREPGTRLIALYLDEYHVTPGENAERLRSAVSRFIDEDVRPGDLLVVMKPLDHLTEIRFSRDREAARAAVSTFTGRRHDYTPKTQFEEQYLGRSPAAVRAARAQIVLSGLRALATRIGDLRGGLGGIVLLSEGFSTDVPRARERRLPDLQGLTRTASRARVMFYAFDPGAGPAQPPESGATGAESAAGSFSLLENLARETGGDAVVAGHDLAPALQRVSRDLDSYYVLTFTSTAPNDGRFRSLAITSTRRDVQVRARSGYWTPLPSELRTTTRALLPSLLPTRALRRSPFIDSWFGLTAEPDGRRRVIFTWTPASGAPASRTKPAARPAVVALKVTTSAGATLFEGEVSPARSGAVSKVRPSSAVFAAAPGRLHFDLIIQQADGSKLDVGAVDFEVPGTRGPTPVILPPQVFRTASAREFREISADANAAPLPGREFRRTERLLLRVPTFEPAGKVVAVSVRLVNRLGAVLIELSPMQGEAGLLPQFDLPLARFAPGEYLIEVAAQSDGGTARELIRFRITG
jgi:VWFA-related protein